MLPRIIRYFRCNTYILLTTFQQVYSFMWLYSALYPFWGQKPKRNKRMIPKLLWRISISQASIHFSSENIKKHKSSHICSWDRSMTFTVKNVGHLKQYSYHRACISGVTSWSYKCPDSINYLRKIYDESIHIANKSKNSCMTRNWKPI